MVQGSVRGGLSGSHARGAWGLVVGAVLGVSLIAGCATEPDPAPEPTAAPTTAPPHPEPSTEEPTAEAPVEPEAPRPLYATPNEHDAQEAAEYFVALYEYAIATGDLSAWSNRGQPTCEFCVSTANSVEELRAQDAVREDVRIDVLSSHVVGVEESLGVFAVEIEYTASAGRVVTSSGDVLGTIEARNGYLMLEVGLAPDRGWLLFTGSAREASVL